jgi:hypothetical protein
VRSDLGDILFAILPFDREGIVNLYLGIAFKDDALDVLESNDDAIGAGDNKNTGDRGNNSLIGQQFFFLGDRALVFPVSIRVENLFDFFVVAILFCLDAGVFPSS